MIEGQYLPCLSLLSVSECVSTRKSKEYVEGLSSKGKLELYETLGKKVEFKRYLHGVSGARLLFKFRSGTQALLTLKHSFNNVKIVRL